MNPNFIITSTCNLNCSYCFANESRTDKRKEEHDMTLEQFKIYVDKFCKEDRYVVFCGGEPTIHPQFIEMFEFALKERNYNVFFLTNGIWPDSVFNYFKNFYSDMRNLFFFSKISIMFNIPEYVYKNDKKELKRVKDVLKFLPERSKRLSLTFNEPDFDARYLIEIAKECGVSNCRQSFAAPYIGDNKDIDFVYKFREYASGLVRFIKESDKAGIKKISSDCGYIPYCAFKKEELSDILSSDNSLITLCSHEGPVDISSQASWRCYGLFGLESKKNSGNDDMDSLNAYWMRTAQLLYNFSIFKNCEHCYYWHNHKCRGGCHATKAKYVIQNYSKELLYPFDNDELLFACIPVKSKWCSLYDNPAGNTLVITSHNDGKVKIVDVKFNYTFDILDICDGVTDLKTIAEFLSNYYKSEGLTFFHVVQHIKYLYSLRVIELIPAYLDKINKIELEQTHQILFFDIKGKIPCYLTDESNNKINCLLLKFSEDFASVFVENGNAVITDEYFFNYDKAKIKVKIVSKESKTFQFKRGIVLDMVFEDIDKNTIDNLLNLTENILAKV